eukprot:scaffold535164_cov33-Prasinocladus_malaysianus.AAC.1
MYVLAPCRQRMKQRAEGVICALESFIGESKDTAGGRQPGIVAAEVRPSPVSHSEPEACRKPP